MAHVTVGLQGLNPKELFIVLRVRILSFASFLPFVFRFFCCRTWKYLKIQQKMENVRNIQLKTWICYFLLLEIYWEHLGVYACFPLEIIVDNVINDYDFRQSTLTICYHLYEIIEAMCCASYNELGSSFVHVIYGFIRFRKVFKLYVSYIIYPTARVDNIYIGINW